MVSIMNRLSVAVLTLLAAMTWPPSSALAQLMPRNANRPVVGPQVPNASGMIIFPLPVTSGFSFPIMMGSAYRSPYPNRITGSSSGASYPGAMGYPPYGMGMYGNQGSYGQSYGGGYGQMYNQPSYRLESQYSSEDRSFGRLLTASGVPNDDGRIRWPIGLRILAGARSEELRDQIDALFQVAGAEAMTGTVDPSVSNQLTRNLDDLRRLLLKDKEERFRMALRTYDEAERFLAKLSAAEKVLKTERGSPASAASAGQGKKSGG